MSYDPTPVSIRDQVAMAICNLTLKYIATPEYAQKIDLIIRQGMMHADLGGPFIRRNDAE